MDFSLSTETIIKGAVFFLFIAYILLNKGKFVQILKFMLKIILAPTGALKRTDALKLNKYRALISQRSHSDFLLYRSYKRKKGDRFGIYRFANSRKGFIIQVSPGPYLGHQLEESLRNLMSDINNDNVSLQFTTYSSSNIKSYFDWFDRIHNKMDALNIDGKFAIRKLNEKKKYYFDKWTRESMISQDSGNIDFRVRNLVNLISVTVKSETKDSQLDNLFTSITGALNTMYPVEFDGRQMIIMGQEIFNPDKKNYSVDDIEAMPMNKVMTRGSRVALIKEENIGKTKITIDDLFDTDGTYKIGSNFLKTYTTESFPTTTTLSEVQSAMFDPFGSTVQITIPCNFISTLTIAFDGVKEDTAKTLQKAKWNVGSLAHIPSTVEEKNPEIKARREEYRDSISAIDKHREKVVRSKMDITIMDKDLRVVEDAGARLCARFKDLPSGSWILMEESKPMVGFLSLLYSLPGQYSSTFKKDFHRFCILYQINNTKIVPLYSDFKGFNDPVMMFAGRTGQAQVYSMYGKGVASYSFVLIGPTGTGKSVWVNELITSSLDCGNVIRSIDLGDSQKRVNTLAGGQYESFEEDKQKCLNFFTNIRTKRAKSAENGEDYDMIHPDELETIVPMIGKMAGIRLSASHIVQNNGIEDDLKIKHATIFIENALHLAYRSRGNNAGMQEVFESLLSMRNVFVKQGAGPQAEFVYNLAIALEDYVIIKEAEGKYKEGKYYKYFNGANNLDIKKDYFLLELMELKKRAPEFISVVIMGVLHKMADEAFSRTDVFKWYLIDEAKEPLVDPLFSHFLDNFALRIRKYNGGIGVITQSVKHFFVNPEAQGVFDSAKFKIFLEQDAASVEYLVNSGKVSLNTFSERLMASVKNREGEYSECMIMNGDKIMISRLKLNPFSYWLYTTNADERTTIRRIAKEFKIDEIEASLYMANLQEFPGISIEDNLSIIYNERSVA